MKLEDGVENPFNDISDDAKDFIKKLIKRSPESRMSADDCLKHKWLAESEPLEDERDGAPSGVGNNNVFIGYSSGEGLYALPLFLVILGEVEYGVLINSKSTLFTFIQ